MSEHDQEIISNLERAQDSLEASQVLLKNSHFDVAVSRAYYAVFYAARAALLSENMDMGKHSGVISFFHQHFVKTKKVDSMLGKDLNWLFELRNIADYGETRHIPEDQTKKAIEVAGNFLSAVKALLNM